MGNYSKTLFGSVIEIKEQTRTKPTGMIAKSIQPKKMSKANANTSYKKKMRANIKKPNSFSK